MGWWVVFRVFQAEIPLKLPFSLAYADPGEEIEWFNALNRPKVHDRRSYRSRSRRPWGLTCRGIAQDAVGVPKSRIQLVWSLVTAGGGWGDGVEDAAAQKLYNMVWRQTLIEKRRKREGASPEGVRLTEVDGSIAEDAVPPSQAEGFGRAVFDSARGGTKALSQWFTGPRDVSRNGGGSVFSYCLSLRGFLLRLSPLCLTCSFCLFSAFHCVSEGATLAAISLPLSQWSRRDRTERAGFDWSPAQLGAPAPRRDRCRQPEAGAAGGRVGPHGRWPARRRQGAGGPRPTCPAAGGGGPACGECGGSPAG